MRRPSVGLPRLFAVALTLLLLGAALPATEAAGSSNANVIVGFEPGRIDSLLIASAGGVLTNSHIGLGLAAVNAADRPGFISAMMNKPGVSFVEPNDPIYAEATAWDGTAWDSTQWDATAWDSTQWDGTAWDGTAWDSTQWDATAWDSTAWDGTAWDSTQWDGTAWDGTAWDGTAWDATAWDGTAWDATAWDGTAWDGTAWDGTAWDGTAWDGTAWDGTAWDGTAWDSTQWDGTAWDGSLWNKTWLGQRAYNGRSTSGDPLFLQQWGYQTIRAAQARANTSAAGITICVLDTGVDASHPDLEGAMWRNALGKTGRDFVNGDDDPSDDAGHGTHVAGIAAAVAKNGIGIAGASNARIMSVKILDANGAGTEFNLALGLQYCRENGARIATMSLSTDLDSPAVARAIRVAQQGGLTLVAAGGNTGNMTTRYPAAYPGVIGVGAMLPNGQPAPFSSGGAHIDVAAPGYAIVSTLPRSGYGAHNGTSMATPFVAATAALMLAANPALNSTQVESRIRASAMDLGPAGWDARVGAGSLRADAAVTAART